MSVRLQGGRLGSRSPGAALSHGLRFLSGSWLTPLFGHTLARQGEGKEFHSLRDCREDIRDRAPADMQWSTLGSRAPGAEGRECSGSGSQQAELGRPRRCPGIDQGRQRCPLTMPVINNSERDTREHPENLRTRNLVETDKA